MRAAPSKLPSLQNPQLFGHRQHGVVQSYGPPAGGFLEPEAGYIEVEVQVRTVCPGHQGGGVLPKGLPLNGLTVIPAVGCPGQSIVQGGKDIRFRPVRAGICPLRLGRGAECTGARDQKQQSQAECAELFFHGSLLFSLFGTIGTINSI